VGHHGVAGRSSRRRLGTSRRRADKQAQVPVGFARRWCRGGGGNGPPQPEALICTSPPSGQQQCGQDPSKRPERARYWAGGNIRHAEQGAVRLVFAATGGKWVVGWRAATSTMVHHDQGVAISEGSRKKTSARCTARLERGSPGTARPRSKSPRLRLRTAPSSGHAILRIPRAPAGQQGRPPSIRVDLEERREQQQHARRVLR